MFSWRLTKAFVLSSDMVMYSGSKSWATDALVEKIRIPWAIKAVAWPLNWVKEIVVAFAFVNAA